MEKTDNELIAEFMGETLSEADLAHNFQLDQLPYRTNWNWLMPVVEKINDGFGTINIDCDSVFIHSESELLSHIYNNQSDRGKIGAVYAAVVYFIKWYNTQKQ